MAQLWRIAPSTLALPVDDKTRKISGGPLIDLQALQGEVSSGSLSAEQVDVANRSCREKLQQLNWTYEEVLDCLLCLENRDFKGSEWCETNWYGLLPCDAYAIRYDEKARRRDRRGLEFYLKFSISGNAAVNLLLVRVHP